MWERHCSLSTLHYQHYQLQPTTEQLRWSFDETREGEKLNKVTHGFIPPLAQGLAFPLLILRNHAPSQFGCSEHRWLGYLIKNAYLHDATT